MLKILSKSLLRAYSSYNISTYHVYNTYGLLYNISWWQRIINFCVSILLILLEMKVVLQSLTQSWKKVS